MTNFIAFDLFLFSIGLYGFIKTDNILRLLMALEILFNAINLNFVYFGNLYDLSFKDGQIAVLFFMALAAAETAIGLTLVLGFYNSKQAIRLEKINRLKY
uniref:NAD(P)H-quinone oxidoreductase subunit 4L, chloroplastic n=1 Tax=Prasinococcus sp. CCMP1194 TaxID=110672 RepID=A0A088CI60_9VIRI|nr:subunit 4L of NADH-plastoquinone oxidoreductase [Prasinococcus sp. CCMP1194]